MHCPIKGVGKKDSEKDRLRGKEVGSLSYTDRQMKMHGCTEIYTADMERVRWGYSADTLSS